MPFRLRRVDAQLSDACTQLDDIARATPDDHWLCGDGPTQADVTVAVIWTLMQIVVADVVTPRDYPALAAFTARAERLPDFLALPPA